MRFPFASYSAWVSHGSTQAITASLFPTSCNVCHVSWSPALTSTGGWRTLPRLRQHSNPRVPYPFALFAKGWARLSAYPFSYSSAICFRAAELLAGLPEYISKVTYRLRRYYGNRHLYFITCSCHRRQAWLGRFIRRHGGVPSPRAHPFAKSAKKWGTHRG